MKLIISKNLKIALYIDLTSFFLISDLDECKTGKNNCPKNSKCQNTIGSFLCNCIKGYKMAIIGGKMVCEGKNSSSLIVILGCYFPPEVTTVCPPYALLVNDDFRSIVDYVISPRALSGKDNING